jgi:hypothetical protein
MIRLRKISEVISVLTILDAVDGTHDYDDIVSELAGLYVRIKSTEFGRLPKLQNKVWRIDDLDPTCCENFLRFSRMGKD